MRIWQICAQKKRCNQAVFYYKNRMNFGVVVRLAM